jgi:hypothetical protein
MNAAMLRAQELEKQVGEFENFAAQNDAAHMFERRDCFQEAAIHLRQRIAELRAEATRLEAAAPVGETPKPQETPWEYHMPIATVRVEAIDGGAAGMQRGWPTIELHKPMLLEVQDGQQLYAYPQYFAAPSLDAASGVPVAWIMYYAPFPDGTPNWDLEIGQQRPAGLNNWQPLYARPIPGFGVASKIKEALEHIRGGLQFAYENGLHEFGYDPVAVIEAALPTPPKEYPC